MHWNSHCYYLNSNVFEQNSGIFVFGYFFLSLSLDLNNKFVRTLNLPIISGHCWICHKIATSRPVFWLLMWPSIISVRRAMISLIPIRKCLFNKTSKIACVSFDWCFERLIIALFSMTQIFKWQINTLNEKKTHTHCVRDVGRTETLDQNSSSREINWNLNQPNDIE